MLVQRAEYQGIGAAGPQDYSFIVLNELASKAMQRFF